MFLYISFNGHQAAQSTHTVYSAYVQNLPGQLNDLKNGDTACGHTVTETAKMAIFAPRNLT